MSYKPDQLNPSVIKITPKRGVVAQNLAVWTTGYDYPLATFLWNIAASRAAANQTEVDNFVKARMDATGENYNTAFNALVLESGMFQLVEPPVEETISVDAQTAQAIRKAATDAGLSTADYLQALMENENEG